MAARAVYELPTAGLYFFYSKFSILPGNRSNTKTSGHLILLTLSTPSKTMSQNNVNMRVFRIKRIMTIPHVYITPIQQL